MTKTIKYIGYYDILRDGKQVRGYSLAGAKKMDYLCSVLNNIGYDVEILSPATKSVRGVGFSKSERLILKDGVSLTLPPSLKHYTPIGRKLKIWIVELWIFIYLLCHCRTGDKILIYHSIGHSLLIKLAKRLLNLDIIMEVEEVYSMVWKQSSFNTWKERRLLKLATDRSLVVSETLADILNIKEPIVSYGNYNPYKGEIPQKGVSDTIKLLYSGSIDKARFSGHLSVMAMRYLPGNYILNISGPVNVHDKEEFLRLIEDTNKELGRNAINYLGILNDTDYNNILLNSDIALNPQKEGEFGNFVFPSKLLSYLAYNLPVVTTKGKSIINSSLRELLYFCDGYNPEDIANAILMVDFEKKTDSREKLEELSLIFRNKLKDRLS